MRKEQFLKASVLLSIAIFCVGCKTNEEPKPIKHPTTVNKPVKIVPQKPSGITLSQLSSEGKVTLALEGSHEYKSGDQIRFSIDTNGAEGYLYVIYLDSKGEVGVIYPNPKAPPAQISGKQTYPEDLGGVKISATKDCQGCEKDKTVLYAFLSKEPILDIQKINKAQLLKITTQKKGIKMDIDDSDSDSGGNINLGVFEFFVK
jgi:hypothetical protein